MPMNLLLRSHELIWYTRFVQLVSAGFVLSVVVLSASEWSAADCTIPPTLRVNIVAASITIPLLVYLLLATGPFRISSLPWSQFVQLGIDLFLLGSWIITTPASEYTCAAACRSCDLPDPSVKEPYSFYLWVGRLTCTCQLRQVKGVRALKHIARKVMRQARRRPGRQLASTKIVTTITRIAQRRHFDLAMIFLFTLTAAMTAYSVYRHHKLVSRLGLGSPHTLPDEVKDNEAAEKRSPSTRSSSPNSLSRTLSDLSDMILRRDSAPTPASP